MAAISPMGPALRKMAPKIGNVSKVGETGAAPKPRGIPKKNTRDYGKGVPQVASPASPPADPFGMTTGSANELGGI